ncbi:uncharacterized protein LOC126567089 [Anopheles maculipalpis]|uniref:uncharacterized protein LOC126567089 n=1 Tax=Anopheles maculipalpis TaxID=1496333 RepID=UPI00215908C1|nr:uncharacterized protein LOC126567089 [Anopheles maculipalpis]
MPRTKQLDVRTIAASLFKKYPGVADVFRMRPNKIRVTAKDRAQANVIAADPEFTEHYRVYIPGSLVEVSGVIQDFEYPEEDIVKYGVGAFQAPGTPKVKVLEAKKLFKLDASAKEGKKYVPTSSIRITFEGTVLPQALIIEGLRIPIDRPYVPRVATCSKCSRIGHADPFCTRKICCGKCRGAHATEECKAPSQKCSHCREDWHEVALCPVYRKLQREQTKTVAERARGSFSDALKGANASNPFAVLDTAANGESNPTAPEQMPLRSAKATRI